MKGKGLMWTYWVLGKGDNVISPSLMMPAGVPQAQSPSLQRQSSHHSSLAAVVLGMMQASKRNNIATTRKSWGRKGQDLRCLFGEEWQKTHFHLSFRFRRLGSGQKVNFNFGVCKELPQTILTKTNQDQPTRHDPNEHLMQFLRDLWGFKKRLNMNK